MAHGVCSKVFASAKRSSESRILDGVSIDATVQKGAIDFMISTQGTNGAFSSLESFTFRNAIAIGR